MHAMEELEVIDNLAMEKQLAGYDRKLREFMIGQFFRFSNLFLYLLIAE